MICGELLNIFHRGGGVLYIPSSSSALPSHEWAYGVNDSTSA